MPRIPGTFERPPGSDIWWISYTDNAGKRRREKVGKYAAALDLLARRRREVKSGEYVAPRSTRVWSFRRLAEAAIKQKELRLAESSIATDTIRLGQLLELCGSVRFDRMTPERIEGVLGKLKAKDLTNSTVNRYRSFISSVFKFAFDTDRIAANPVKKVQRFKENDPRVRWLRAEEEAKLRREIIEDRHEWELDLALHTGMRRGEQFGLLWKNIDLDRGHLTCRGKTGRRHIVLNKAAIGALQKLQVISGDGEFVIQELNEKKKNPKRDWRNWFELAIKRAGIRDFTWHDLRHTFASRLVMNGVDIRTVQELCGHKSIVMTMKYAHLSADHRQRAVEKTGAPAAARRRSV